MKDIPKLEALKHIIANQELYNKDHSDPKFKEFATSMAVKIFSELIVHEIGSVEVSTECVQEHPLKCNWVILEGNDNNLACAMRDELARVMCDEITCDINNSIIKKIKACAEKIKVSFNKPTQEKTYQEFCEDVIKCFTRDCAAKIKKNSGSDPNWMITSPELASLFERSENFKRDLNRTKNQTLGPINPQYIGRITLSHNCNIFSVDVFEYVLFPTNQILMGCGGPHVKNGYVFYPDTMLKQKIGQLTCSYNHEVIYPEFFALADMDNWKEAFP